MYVFRSKNTRDNRSPAVKSIFKADTIHSGFDLRGDDAFRLNAEDDYVDHFCYSHQTLLGDYLDTPNGKIEVEALRKELGNARLLKLNADKKWGVISVFQSKIDPLSLIDEEEAIDLIIEAGVRKVETDSLAEYRRAHPPPFLCRICKESFLTATELAFHDDNSSEYHADFEQDEKSLQERGQAVEGLLKGNQGRIFKANRLIFSPQFAPTGENISKIRENHLRPLLSDTGGTRAAQQTMGHMVMGFNPVNGVRPQYRTFGMTRQHNNPGHRSGGNKDIPQLKDVLLDLAYLKNKNVGHDFATVPTVGSHVGVRFMWKGTALESTAVVGDFSGWKAIPLVNTDPYLAKNFHIQDLSVGKYRYLYVVDGVECIDESATVIEVCI
jgi:hypothetical protein